MRPIAINRDDIEEIMNNYNQELTLEDLEEITATQNKPNYNLWRIKRKKNL